MPTKPRRGRAAKHIVEVLPTEYVQQELFEFVNRGSLRKMMSRHGIRAVYGYRYEDVKRVYESWDPSKSWDRSPKEFAEDE